MSVIFRTIPLVMGVICAAYGLYVYAGGPNSNHFVAGHVVVALAAICYALFTTAATIIRQLIDRYNKIWRVSCPSAGTRSPCSRSSTGSSSSPEVGHPRTWWPVTWSPASA